MGYSAVYHYFDGISKPDLLKKLMVEDSTAAELSYKDYATRIHKIVLNKITNNE